MKAKYKQRLCQEAVWCNLQPQEQLCPHHNGFGQAHNQAASPTMSAALHCGAYTSFTSSRQGRYVCIYGLQVSACVLDINRAVSSNIIITGWLAILYCFRGSLHESLPRQETHCQHQAGPSPGCAPRRSIQEDRGPLTTKDIPQGSMSVQLH